MNSEHENRSVPTYRDQRERNGFLLFNIYQIQLILHQDKSGLIHVNNAG